MGFLGTHTRVWALLLVILGWALDQVNCPTKLHLRLAGEREFRLQEFRLDEPDCAFEGVATVTGVATGSANLLELVRGYEPILRSARADAERRAVPVGGLAPELQLTLLSFDHDGYRATFRAGRRKETQKHTEATGRPCAVERERRARHDEELPCDADHDLKRDALLAPYGTSVLEYTSTRDFAAQRLTLEVIYCEDEPEVPTW